MTVFICYNSIVAFSDRRFEVLLLLSDRRQTNGVK